MRKELLAVCVLGWISTAVAQMPHQVAVLVNKNSQASKKAAGFFAATHWVPGLNMIYLDLPESMVTGRAECTPEEFLEHIYNPAQKVIEERGLSDQILAWVYSVDFPIRILNSANDRQQMSIMGLTFTRGRVPAAEMIEKGRFGSPLFGGPVKPGAQKLPSFSFDVRRKGLKENMPLPSMMLGYIGENGSDLTTVLKCIQRGAQARTGGKNPRILLVQTDDEKRSGPREWQFPEVKAEMAQRNGEVMIFTNQPPAQTNLMGVMVGAADVKPAEFGTFAPGAMAEHFTSWSAEFQKPQSKCTEWLEAGATVTAGMVTEPYNAWIKFPHARFFVHYANGCTAMESFYQSVLSPLQILFLGDPLSQISVLPIQIKTVGLDKSIDSNLDAAFVIKAQTMPPVGLLYSYLIDDRLLSDMDTSTLVEIPFDELGDGYHEARLIAQVRNSVAAGGAVIRGFYIDKKGRTFECAGIEDRAPEIALKVQPGGEDRPAEAYVLWNGRQMDRKPYADGMELLLDERVLGEGPHRLQVVAVYEDGMEVRSAPQNISIVFSNPAS